MMHTLAATKYALLQYAAQFPFCAYLDNCESTVDKYGHYELMVAIAPENARTFRSWEAMKSVENTWLFGVLPYELKDVFEQNLLQTQTSDIPFSEVCFFAPETIWYIKRGSNKLEHWGKESDFQSSDSSSSTSVQNPIHFESNFTESRYLATIAQIKSDIKEGDYYELNLAQRFLAQTQLVNPAQTFWNLIQISPVPFATFMRFKTQYLLCASPERFLQLSDNQLVSQPIKGTSKREKDVFEDEKQRAYLRNSEKEQAENIMIVDLMRNDLYRSAEINSVSVPHLFEIQSFPTVHQMVSTVVAQKRKDVSWQKTIENTFPAGSMTGAPKIMTMNRIAQYEGISRGIYAGSAGYVSPSGDYDFNVVIRSLVYDAAQKRLSYHVGGAITYDSAPAQEYEETLIKAVAIRKVFGG